MIRTFKKDSRNDTEKTKSDRSFSILSNISKIYKMYLYKQILKICKFFILKICYRLSMRTLERLHAIDQTIERERERERDSHVGFLVTILTDLSKAFHDLLHTLFVIKRQA